MMSTLERREGGKCQKCDEGDGGSPATVSATTTTTNITMPDGQVLTLSDFISRFGMHYSQLYIHPLHKHTL